MSSRAMRLRWQKYAYLLALICSPAQAVDQSGITVSGENSHYIDNRGLERDRLGARVQGQVGKDSSVDATFSRDHYMRQLNAAPEELRPDDAVSYERTDASSISVSHNHTKTFSTRAFGAYSDGRGSYSRTWGAGFGYWFLHENWQFTLDANRSLANRPETNFLDYDFEIIEPSSVVDRKTVSVGLKQLASPKTIVDYGIAYSVQKNRPDTQSYSTKIKQHIAALKGSFHLGVNRSINTGEIATETAYGEVTSWKVEPAYLQNVSKQTIARVGYRYYREDETTRAYGDELTFGSDLLSLGVSHQMTPSTQVDWGLSRYVTNTDLVADIVEFGLTSGF